MVLSRQRYISRNCFLWLLCCFSRRAFLIKVMKMDVLQLNDQERYIQVFLMRETWGQCGTHETGWQTNREKNLGCSRVRRLKCSIFVTMQSKLSMLYLICVPSITLWSDIRDHFQKQVWSTITLGRLFAFLFMLIIN